MSRLTSITFVPLPRAMRFLRLPLMTVWSRRSRMVIESIIAMTRLSLALRHLPFHSAFQLLAAGQHAQDLIQRPQLVDLSELSTEIFERKRVRC